MIIFNTNQKSKDYSHIAKSYRPSHADFTYQEKYGIRDYRGGGRSSARETAARVAAGALAKLVLNQLGVKVVAYVSQVGPLKTDKPYISLDLSKTENNIVRCPDEAMADKMITYIDQIRKSGDTVGGIVTAVITGVPVGLGEPVFDKLHARLGAAMLGINAVKGFEYGSGFEGAAMKGSDHNDIIEKTEDVISTKTNLSGGIQGGISNGEDIYFNVAFKPVATIMRDQPSIDQDGKEVTVSGRGRHDPCVLPRAVPIVEAMAALTIMDFYLLHQSTKLN
jgi:chorismate synthase